MSEPWKDLEPEARRAAQTAASMYRDGIPADVENGVCAYSQAISLKRIANNSDRIALALETLAVELAHPEWGVAPAIREAARGK